jgi:predicted RNA-binding Zn ribbon-like protein
LTRPMAEIPSEVETVLGFVNTLDLESEADELDTPDALTGWLESRGLLRGGGAATSRDLERAIQLREALRALLRAHHDATVDSDAIRKLNSAASDLPLSVVFDSRGNPDVVPGQAGIAGALGGILSAVARAEAAGSWARLKVCSMDTCQWAFYDRSKNRSGRWCSMGVCGNRAKTRSYRDRRRSG